MKKTLALTLSLSLATLLFTGCGQSKAPAASSPAASEPAVSQPAASLPVPQGTTYPITITHDLGQTVIQAQPQRVVVFDFGTLDTIDELGLDVALALPKSNVPSYLEKYTGDEYLNAGGIKEPDLEAIHEFAPDLIVIAARQADYFEQLNAIAPTVYMNVHAKHYMEDFTRNMGWLGEIFNVSDQMDTRLAAIDTQISEVSASVAPEDRALIILTNDGNISAYGSGSRFGMIHDLIGVPQADESIEVSTHGSSVDYEYIAQVNPEILLVVDRTAVVGGDTTSTSTLDNDLVSSTSAAQNGRIYYLNPDVWYLSGGGLQSVSMMLQEIARIYA